MPEPAAPTPPAAAMAAPFTERQFRDAMAQFATGITVICTRRPDGRFVGFTANSFNSVSLDPPLILWSLAHTGSHLADFREAPAYSINVLAHDQVELARRFSRPHADRFEGVGHVVGASGAPLLDGCVAWFECRHHALSDVGDHVLFVGRVEHCARRGGAGLVFQHGRYGTSQPLP